MSISSVALSDLGVICRALIGRDAVSADRIGTGRNSRVFRIRLNEAGAGPSDVVLKVYRRDRGDLRDRLATEFSALEFLWQNGVRVVPYPIAVDRDRYCAMYEFISGCVPDPPAVDGRDIDAAVRLLSELRALGARAASAALSPASEANFSLQALAAHVVARFGRLRAGGTDGERRPMMAWLETTFEPLLDDVRTWCRGEATRAQIDFDAELGARDRTLSPSDFGFHNAIRRPDGSLAFVDFEYFGWDDPAKTIADFLLHPAMALSEPLKRRFAVSALSAYADVPRLLDRVRIVYPLFGLKWCLILLNDFMSERLAADESHDGGGAAAAERRAAQLRAADLLARRLDREYRDSPLLINA